MLERVAAGNSHGDVAAELDISEHTVRNHLRNVLGKLHLFTRSQATSRAGAADGADPAVRDDPAADPA